MNSRDRLFNMFVLESNEFGCGLQSACSQESDVKEPSAGGEYTSLAAMLGIMNDLPLE
jgi:hypothetical protein